MRNFEVILFDLDGTLIHSAPGIFATLSDILARYNVFRTHEQLQKYVGPPLREAFAELLPQQDVEDAVQAYRDLYAIQGTNGCSPFEGVVDILETLKAKGFILCVATSKPLPAAKVVLEHFGLTDYFTVIGGASLDQSLDTKTAVMQSVLCQEAVAGKLAIMIGDRYHDLEGAQNCNVPAIGVTYGYGSKEELSVYNPVALCDSAPQVCDTLLQMAEA